MTFNGFMNKAFNYIDFSFSISQCFYGKRIGTASNIGRKWSEMSRRVKLYQQQTRIEKPVKHFRWSVLRK